MALVPKNLPRSLPSEIAKQVEREIISGGYALGQRLVERDLAARFGVSPIPVREALQTLENRGLAHRKPHRGYSVIDLSREEIERLGEFRTLLELQVIRWAAERIDPEGARDLEAQLEKLRQAAEAANYAEFFCEDLDLHRLLWVQSKNPFAASALERGIGSLFASGLRESEGLNLKEEFAKHVRLVAAVLARNPDDAAKTLEDIARGFQDHMSSHLAVNHE